MANWNPVTQKPEKSGNYLVALREDNSHDNPTTEEQYFPYFMLEFGRTEDMWFYETAIRVGYKPYVDTSVECQHITEKVVCGDTYREYLIETETSQVVMTEYNLEAE